MVLIKVADISNEARPMDVAEPWLDRLLQVRQVYSSLLDIVTAVEFKFTFKSQVSTSIVIGLLTRLISSAFSCVSTSSAGHVDPCLAQGQGRRRELLVIALKSPGNKGRGWLPPATRDLTHQSWVTETLCFCRKGTTVLSLVCMKGTMGSSKRAHVSRHQCINKLHQKHVLRSE